MISTRRRTASAVGLLLAGAAATAAPALASSAAANASTTVPHCRTSGLAVSLTNKQGTAGSTYVDIVLRNTSGHRCLAGGYAGVSYVGDGNGSQIGHAAVRVHHAQVTTVILRPGHRAVATLREVNAGDYADSVCTPHAVDGLRIYPPNQTSAAYAPQPTTGCENH